MKQLELGTFAHNFWKKVSDFRDQRFFRDKLSLSLLVPALLLNVLTLLIMVFRLKSVQFSVPVHYSSLTGFDQLGQWYQTYTIGFFGLLVTMVNTVLAVHSFNQSRITSFFIMVGAFVVALFCLIIGTAFAVIV